MIEGRFVVALLAGIAITSSVHSAHARPDEPPNTAVDPAAREKSRAAFRKGVAQLRAQDWVGARASFEEAWSLVQHPSILLNLGIARLRTDDPVLAEQDLVRFLSEDSGAAPEELTSARDALAEARTKIGTLRVVASPATARVMIDGKPVAIRAPDGATNSDGVGGGGGGGIAEAKLKVGKHTVAVEAEGFTSEQRSVDVTSKGETDVKIALVAKDTTNVPPKPGPTTPRDGPSTRTIVGWSLAGFGGVALLTSGIMALRASSLSSDYESPSSGGSFQNPDVRSEGIAFRTGADIALITALLAGAGAIVLLFTDLGAPAAADHAGLSSSRHLKSLERRSSQPVLRW